MPRIRTIKPELWTDERLGECSTSARLLFVASLNFADDSGNLDRSSRQLKAQVFPYDDTDAEPLVLELLRVGRYVEYEIGDCKYLHIKNFEQHQRIDRPSKSRIPLYEPSLKTRRVFDEPSTSTRAVREGKGEEGKGIRIKKNTVAGIAARLPADWAPNSSDVQYALALKLNPAAIAEAFKDYWAAEGGANARKLDWRAAWRTWCRRQTVGVPRTNGNGGGFAQPQAPVRNLTTDWIALEAHAKLIGYRAPLKHVESIDAFRSELKIFEGLGPTQRAKELARRMTTQ